MNPAVNSGLSVIIMCQGRFIACNRCTTLMRHVDSRGGLGWRVGKGVYENSLYFPLHFAVNLKTALKK